MSLLCLYFWKMALWNIGRLIDRAPTAQHQQGQYLTPLLSGIFSSSKMFSVHLIGISWQVMNHFSFLLLSRFFSLSLTFSTSTTMQLFIKIQWVSLLLSYFDFIEHPGCSSRLLFVNKFEMFSAIVSANIFFLFSFSLIFPPCICWYV